MLTDGTLSWGKGHREIVGMQQTFYLGSVKQQDQRAEDVASDSGDTEAAVMLDMEPVDAVCRQTSHLAQPCRSRSQPKRRHTDGPQR